MKIVRNNFRAAKKMVVDNKYIDFAKNLGISVVIFIFFYIVALMVNKLFNKYVENNDKLKDVSKTLFYDFVRKMLYFVIIGAGLLIAAARLGFNIGTLMVIIGSIGLALALCLKDFLGQFISGLAILFFQYFKLNDLIKIGDDMGTVTNFNLLNTSLTTPQNIVITVPNNDIMTKSFVNYSKNKEIFIGTELCVSNNAKVDYKSLIDKLDAEIKKISYIVNGETNTKLDSLAGSGTKIMVQIKIKPENYAKAMKELNLVSRQVMGKDNVLMCDNFYIK